MGYTSDYEQCSNHLQLDIISIYFHLQLENVVHMCNDNWGLLRELRPSSCKPSDSIQLCFLSDALVAIL